MSRDRGGPGDGGQAGGRDPLEPQPGNFRDREKSVQKQSQGGDDGPPRETYVLSERQKRWKPPGAPANWVQPDITPHIVAGNLRETAWNFRQQEHAIGREIKELQNKNADRDVIALREADKLFFKANADSIGTRIECDSHSGN